jgi:trigger factor
MQVSVETTGNLGRRMRIAVPADRFEQEFSSRLKRLSQKVRMPGFRPGKVPMRMVEAQYGGQVMEEVVTDLIRSSFAEAVDKEGLRPAGGPKIEPKVVGRGQDFEYVAEFDVYPEIKLTSVGGVAIERPRVEIQSDDIERTVETMRKQRISYTDVAREARDGDRVTIDFKGFVDGTAFEGGEAKDFPLVLGSHSLIDGFEEGLLGAKAGETRTIDVKFPEDYRNKNLAGKAAQFEVTAKQIAEAVLPVVDEAFARALGVGDGSVDSLRAEVRTNLEREAQERVRTLLRQRVFKVLTEANRFEIPAGLLEQEMARLLRLNRDTLKAQGMPKEQLPNDAAIYKDRAEQRVSLGLILAEIVKAKGIHVDGTKVRARVEEMAASYESPDDFVRWYYSQSERLAEMESLVLEEQVVEVLLNEMQVSDKAMSFQELMQQV